MKEDINEEIIGLWRDFQDEFDLERIPLVYPELNDAEVLFVGLNPSFNDSWNEENLNVSYEEFFSWTDEMEDKMAKIKKREVDAREDYSYFQHFREWFGAWDEGQWEHIDLFCYRMTSQSDLKEKVGISSDKTQTDFAEKQFKLNMRLIENLEPEIIVVVNALASKIIQNESGEFYGISESLDEGYGCYYLNMNGKEYPILFSGMVTGRRALDVGSRERLRWQIDKILD
jgi:hypothetical protein